MICYHKTGNAVAIYHGGFHQQEVASIPQVLKNEEGNLDPGYMNTGHLD